MAWIQNPDELMTVLRELALHGESGPWRDVLSEAVPSLENEEYDNWNGGTTYYSLVLRVPVPLYAQVEDQLEETEKRILARIEKIQREKTNDLVREVLVQPRAAGTSRQPTLASDGL